MKIKMNKDLVSIAQKETVKNAIADFKGYFTENDLVRMYAENFGYEFYFTSYDVLKCDVSAFLQNDWTENAAFSVDMVIETAVYFIKIHFYVDEENGMYCINNDPILREMIVYKAN